MRPEYATLGIGSALGAIIGGLRSSDKKYGRLYNAIVGALLGGAGGYGFGKVMDDLHGVSKATVPVGSGAVDVELPGHVGAYDARKVVDSAKDYANNTHDVRSLEPAFGVINENMTGGPVVVSGLNSVDKSKVPERFQGLSRLLGDPDKVSLSITGKPNIRAVDGNTIAMDDAGFRVDTGTGNPWSLEFNGGARIKLVDKPDQGAASEVAGTATPVKEEPVQGVAAPEPAASEQASPQPAEVPQAGIEQPQGETSAEPGTTDDQAQSARHDEAVEGMKRMLGIVMTEPGIVFDTDGNLDSDLTADIDAVMPWFGDLTEGEQRAFADSMRYLSMGTKGMAEALGENGAVGKKLYGTQFFRNLPVSMQNDIMTFAGRIPANADDAKTRTLAKALYWDAEWVMGRPYMEEGYDIDTARALGQRHMLPKNAVSAITGAYGLIGDEQKNDVGRFALGIVHTQDPARREALSGDLVKRLGSYVLDSDGNSQADITLRYGLNPEAQAVGKLNELGVLGTAAEKKYYKTVKVPVPVPIGFVGGRKGRKPEKARTEVVLDMDKINAAYDRHRIDNIARMYGPSVAAVFGFKQSKRGSFDSGFIGSLIRIGGRHAS